MKKNTKPSRKQSVVANTTVYFGVIVIALAVMVILNVLASASFSQAQKVCAEHEQELKRLENERTNEVLAWNVMVTPDNLNAMLRLRGLCMDKPTTFQIVRVMPNGQLFPGQRSVAKALREQQEPVVSYKRKKR